MKSLFLSFHNALDYPLRQLFHWRRKGLRLPNEAKDGLYAHLSGPERQRANELTTALQERYNLRWLYENSRADNFRENLYYLHLLETAFEQAGVTLPAEIYVADIGPSTWFYVQALHTLLSRWQAPGGRQAALRGFEADPYRIYTDFHSRYDYAQAHIGRLENVIYHSHPFPIQPDKFDIIFMLFPFVFPGDHLQWGLPRGMFDPAQLLECAAASLKPGGWLVVANQGQAEHARQLELLEAARLPVKTSFEHISPLYAYDFPRYVTVACRKPG